MQINNYILSPRPKLHFYDEQEKTENQAGSQSHIKQVHLVELSGALIEASPDFLAGLKASLSGEIRLADDRLGNLNGRVKSYWFKEVGPTRISYQLIIQLKT